MEIGKEQLPGAQHATLIGLRFFDLHHHISVRKDLFGAGDNVGTCGFIIGVAKANSCSTVVFDPHLMTVTDQLPHACRGHTNAIFMVLDLFGDAYQHETASCDSIQLAIRQSYGE